MILSKRRITKALISLRGCAGWSAPMLFANPRRQVGRGPFYVKLYPCLKQQFLQMVSIYNFENTGRKLKPDNLICCINVFIEEVGNLSMNDTGEKGYNSSKQIVFNFLAL